MGKKTRDHSSAGGINKGKSLEIRSKTMGSIASIRVSLFLVLLLMPAAAHCESQPDFDVRLGGERSAWPQALPKLQLRVADLRGWTPAAISDCVAVFKERRYRCSLGKEGV